MDIFDIHDIKAEKANAMLQYRRFKTLAKLFRVTELFLAVILISWISSRLPLVVGIISDYFRQLLSVVVNPLFIFVIGNVIILILVVKSCQISDNHIHRDLGYTGSDLYEEIANNVREDAIPPVMNRKPEEIVYQDKRIVSEVITKPNSYCCNDNKIKVRQVTNKPLAPNSVMDLKTYRRTQSENLMKRECFLGRNKVNGKLRRSETEIGRQEVETPVTEKVVVDELSNEEFKMRIEGFIASQNRFRHEEKLAIVES